MDTSSETSKRDSNGGFFNSRIFNTLVLGGILALITFGLNHKLEKFKAKESFRSEYNKIKVQKLGECWAGINEWEAQLSLFLDHKRNYLLSHQSQDSLFANDLSIKITGYDKLFLIERNRFWIGEDEYNILGEFALLVTRKANHYSNFNQDSINLINNLIHQKRLEADEYFNEMLKSK